MAATGDLRNLLKTEERHHRGRVGAESVEDAAADGNDERDDTELPSFDAPGLACVIAGFTAVERRFFDLLKSGEKRTPVLAAVLGLADAPKTAQEHEVKKMRDSAG